ncbi:MAG: hypothetical protein HKO53_12470, partial [Gemmatimonadetes bacterium]|nr:hypothetical protein [Gemmatimonadota bacterium]
MKSLRTPLFLFALLALASSAWATEVTFQFRAENAQQVYLAGEFNGWSDSALALTDEDGDGVWVATLDLDAGSYQYKFVVDGNWMPDPSATATADDGFGGENSIVQVSGDALVIGPDGSGGGAPSPPRETAPAGAREVRFLCKADDGATVHLAGDFNQWSDSAQKMEKAADGVFQAVLPLTPGRYQYKFVIGGSWKEDPHARAFQDDGFGGQNSVVEVAAGDGILDAGNYADMADVPEPTTSAPSTSDKELGDPVSGNRSVSFSYQPVISGVKDVFLAGTFNDWNVGATPMSDADGDGTYETTLLLAAGTYQYKFVVDGSTWITPDDADDFADDGFGGQNAVIVVDSRFDGIETEVGDGDIFTDGIEFTVDYSTINEVRDGEFIVQAHAYRDDIEGITLHWQEEGGTAQSKPMRAGDRATVHTSYRTTIRTTPGKPVHFTFQYRDGGESLFATASGFVEQQPDVAQWLTVSREILPPFRIPEWAQKGVYYQIFPERFANGSPENDQDFSEPYYDERKTLPASGKLNGEYFHFVEDWNDVGGLIRSPYRTDGKPDYYSFYGGDIAGIRQKLDYLNDLG